MWAIFDKYLLPIFSGLLLVIALQGPNTRPFFSLGAPVSSVPPRVLSEGASMPAFSDFRDVPADVAEFIVDLVVRWPLATLAQLQVDALPDTQTASARPAIRADALDNAISVTSLGSRTWVERVRSAISVEILRIGIRTEPLTLEPDLTVASVVTGDRVNLRDGPGMETNVYEQLPIGEKVFVQEQFGAWSRVALDDGRWGWMSTQYVS